MVRRMEIRYGREMDHEDLDQLASEIGALQRAADRLTDVGAIHFADQVMAHCQRVLSHSLDRPGALTGEMPWWRDWDRP